MLLLRHRKVPFAMALIHVIVLTPVLVLTLFMALAICYGVQACYGVNACYGDNPGYSLIYFFGVNHVMVLTRVIV